MAIPILVSINPSMSFQYDGKDITGNVTGDKVGITLELNKDRAILKEPFKNSIISMDAKDLHAINVIVNPDQVYVLGNYLPDAVDRCCVTLCNIHACCKSVTLTCNGITVKCP